MEHDMNLAQQIYRLFGKPTAHVGGKNASFTKKGPGRKHQQGKRG